MNYLLTRTQTILTPEEGWQLIQSAQQDLKSCQLQLKYIQALIQAYLKLENTHE